MPRVLVVDDDPDIAIICSLVLESEGYETGVASNGVDAYKAITSDGIDVVLLDVMMPAMDGITVCKLVKENPTTSDLPIIIMSASVRMREQARKSKADAILEKPFNIDQLIETVHQFVS